MSNKKSTTGGIRTPNLLIRSQTPHPLGHAAMYTVNCICYFFSYQVLSLVRTSLVRTSLVSNKKSTTGGIRTPNLLIRSQTPYPLGHAAMYTVNCICYFFSYQVLSLVRTSLVRTSLVSNKKSTTGGIRTPNLLIRSQTPHPLGHAAMYTVNCICYFFSYQVLSLVRTSLVRTSLVSNKKSTTGGIRTPNLLIRSQTPYPLGHAAMYTVNCICYFFSYQVLSLVRTSLVRTFLCVKQKIDHRRYSNPQSPDSKSDASSVGPCGHVYCQLYLLLLQLPSVVPCKDFPCKNFPCVKQKIDHRRYSNPQSSDSKSDALSVGPCGHVYCQLYLLLLQLPSVVPCKDFPCKNFPCVKQKIDHRRYSNPQSSDSKSDALSVGPCGHVYCQLYLLLLQLPSVVPCKDFLCKNFPCVKQKVDHRGIRTLNLQFM